MVLGIKAGYETRGGNYLMRSDRIGHAYLKEVKPLWKNSLPNQMPERHWEWWGMCLGLLEVY